MQTNKSAGEAVVRRRKRPRWFGVTMAFVLTFVLTACSGSSEISTTQKPAGTVAGGAAAPLATIKAKIAISTSKSSAFIQTFVADEAGIFKKCGIEAEIIAVQAAQAAAALANGDVDVTVTAGSTVRAAYEGIPVRNVAVTMNNFESSILAYDIKSAKDLTGKKIVSSPATASPGIGLRAALSDLGFTPGKDIEIVDVSDTAQRVTLLEAKQVDAGLISADGALRLMKTNPNLNIVYEPKNFPTNPYMGVAVATSRIAKDPEYVKRVISAYIATTKFMLDNPAETKKIYAKVFELDADQASKLYDLTSPLLVKDGLMNDDMWKGQARLDTLGLKKDVTVDQVKAGFDLSLVTGLKPSC